MCLIDDRLKQFDKHLFEPPHGKTNNMHRRKQKTQISFAVTAKLISAFVFATGIVQFLFYFNPKFQASSSFLLLCRPVCVGPVRKPHCWFSHEAAHLLAKRTLNFSWVGFVNESIYTTDNHVVLYTNHAINDR